MALTPSGRDGRAEPRHGVDPVWWRVLGKRARGRRCHGHTRLRSVCRDDMYWRAPAKLHRKRCRAIVVGSKRVFGSVAHHTTSRPGDAELSMLRSRGRPRRPTTEVWNIVRAAAADGGKNTKPRYPNHQQGSNTETLKSTKSHTNHRFGVAPVLVGAPPGVARFRCDSSRTAASTARWPHRGAVCRSGRRAHYCFAFRAMTNCRVISQTICF